MERTLSSLFALSFFATLFRTSLGQLRQLNQLRNFRMLRLTAGAAPFVITFFTENSFTYFLHYTLFLCHVSSNQIILDSVKKWPETTTKSKRTYWLILQVIFFAPYTSVTGTGYLR